MLVKKDAMITEKHIKLAADFYKVRDAAKSMYGLSYKETLTPYIKVIQSLMIEKNTTAVVALLDILEATQREATTKDQILFVAAATEMLEPSE